MKNNTNNKIKIYPSFLSADFSHIADESKKIEDAGADGIHLDIMDGHFVPNLTMGPKIVAAINRSTNLFLDVHLMMYNPFDYIERFIEVGADMISFHLEATEDVEENIDYVKKCGKKVAIAINPETPVSLILKYLDRIDGVLIMSVNPGFGGQKFMDISLEKIEFIKDVCMKLGTSDKNISDLEIQVDGGINNETGKLCLDKGATTLISGNYLFSQKDMKEAISNLRKR